ncbi:MAG: SRPBCC family protein [Cyclobacteriaceae bacterium]
MKKTSLYALLVVLLITNSQSVFAQSMNKTFKSVKAEIHINAPADKVWEAMVLDYGEISYFSPYVYSSDYEAGSLKGELGAKRRCAFNAKGTQVSYERIGDLDAKNMVMRNVVIGGEKLPLNFDNSQAFYRVRDNGDGTSTASYEFQYRTKPGIMTGLVKGTFQKQLAGTLIGLKHYIETGEKVNPETGLYKEIKDDYEVRTGDDVTLLNQGEF